MYKFSSAVSCECGNSLIFATADKTDWTKPRTEQLSDAKKLNLGIYGDYIVVDELKELIFRIIITLRE